MSSAPQIVVARADNLVIGAGGAMPWRLPEDLAYFKRLTTGSAVVMGRRTHESIGRALPGRHNIVISRRPDYRPVAPAEAVTSLSEALARAAGERVFIIGGAEIYRLALPLTETCWVTEVRASFAGDAFFPELPPSAWWRSELSALPATADRPALIFCRYDRLP